MLPETPGVSQTAPGVLPEAPCERSGGTLGVLVDALLTLVDLSWGASGRVGAALGSLVLLSVLTCGARVRS